ncbi:ABC transporter permease [Candidatus Thorarchaeota archaeon]|nr:MAG: ABC transporter permease [Candidatus Thorarchaeota archaeon]
MFAVMRRMAIVESGEADAKTHPVSKSSMGTIHRRIILKVFLPLIILLILWQIIATLARTSLIEVIEAFVQLAIEGDSEGAYLSDHIFASLFRVLIGFTTAAATAIPLGILIGRYRLADSIFGPVIEAMRPIPPIAWIPLSILLFSSNMLGAQAFIIWIGAFFPILINTTTGVKRTEPVHIDAAKTLGARETQILWKIVIPSASPEIFAGIRIGFGISWMCLVAAEMIGGRVGLGYLVWIMQQVGRTGAVISSMFLIGLIGFLITYFFLYIERHLIKWKQSVSV